MISSLNSLQLLAEWTSVRPTHVVSELSCGVSKIQVAKRDEIRLLRGFSSIE